jgi:hypothetical protein
MQQFRDNTPSNPKTTADVVGIFELCAIIRGFSMKLLCCLKNNF